MELSTLFFLSSIVAIIGIVGAVINMTVAYKNATTLSNATVVAVIHVICSLLGGIAGTTALVTGVIWLIKRYF
jgi:hypothetical protein